MFEFTIVLSDGTIKSVVALSMKDALAQIEETEDVKVLNAFRKSSVPIDAVQKVITISASFTDENGEPIPDSGCSVTPSEPVLFASDTTFTLSAVAGEGWDFAEWKLDGETVSTEPEVSLVSGTSDVHYVAVFNAVKPVVHVEDSAAEAGCSVLTTYADSKVTLTAELPPEGALFAGWYKDEEYEDVLNVEPSVELDVPIPDDWVEVYAKFTPTTPIEPSFNPPGETPSIVAQM